MVREPQNPIGGSRRGGERQRVRQRVRECERERRGGRIEEAGKEGRSRNGAQKNDV